MNETYVVYDRIPTPTTTIAAELKKKGLIKWQRQCEST
jgi:hypothetical protein